MNIEILKTKSAIVVLEGFGVLIASHAIGGYYLAPLLAEVIPKLSSLTIAILSSTAISPFLATIYLAVRVRFVPKFNIKKEALLYLPSGIILAWIVVFINVLLSGKENPYAYEVLKSPQPYYYLNLFLITIWSALLEEILNRGYFFEILRVRWGDTQALLLSSIIFVMPHGMWGSFDISLIFIFLYSVIFTVIYMRGGLIIAILVHAFVNFYLLYLNT